MPRGPWQQVPRTPTIPAPGGAAGHRYACPGGAAPPPAPVVAADGLLALLVSVFVPKEESAPRESEEANHSRQLAN